MKVFIGSSRESLEKAEDIAEVISEKGHTPNIWNKAFTPSKFAFECLEDIAQSVDAAIFVFSEDDILWYRENDAIPAVRDNVLIEYGFFCGALGRSNVIIAFNGKPKIASDLSGITYIDIKEMAQAIPKIRNWLKGCHKKHTTNIGQLMQEANAFKDLYPNSDEAINKYDEILALYPNCLEAQVEIAWIYYLKGNYLKAAHLLEEVIATFKRGKVYYMIGCSYMAEKDYERAISFFEKSIYIDNGSYACQSHKYLGEIFTYLGNNNEADKHYKLSES